MVDLMRWILHGLHIRVILFSERYVGDIAWCILNGEYRVVNIMLRILHDVYSIVKTIS